jgi:peptide/nickel transport system substrate-binding protein
VGINRSRRVMISTIACLSLLATACTSSSGSSTTSDTPAASSGAAKSGGTLTFGWLAETQDMWPSSSPSGGRTVIGAPERMAVYDALVIYGSSGVLQYRLAQSLTPASDNGTWKLTLRSGLKFSDGTPFNAAAVKFNWDSILEPKSGSALSAPLVKSTIASTTVISPTELSIKLVKPDPGFPAMLAQTSLIWIGSPTAMTTEGADFGNKPVGAGPFEIKDWVRNDQMTLVRNKYYSGKVNLNQVVIKILPDEQQRYNTLASGGLNVFFTAVASTSVKAKSDHYGVSTSTENGGVSMFFNTAKAPFDNVLARQAVAYAFDVSAMNKALYGGAATPVTTLFRPNSPLYTDVPLIKADAAKAQQLFDQYARQTGHPLTFSEPGLTGVTIDQAQWLQASLASFKNVKMTVNPVSGTTGAQEIQTGDFQAIIITSPSFNDPYPSLNRYLQTGGPANFGKFSDPALDKALTDGAATTDVAARKAAYQIAQQEIAAKVPVVFTVREPTANIYQTKAIGALPTLADGLIDWAAAWVK